VALQSWGISQESVRLILLAMQTMQFFLRTGYGESAETYGGSIEDRTLGLGQGNAATGPGFMALSAQIVNAYLRDGHGSRTMMRHTFHLFALAAVLYVNDMDLIHITALVTASPSDLVQLSQISTNAWGGLVIATGASLKPEKCFAYFQVYKFPGRRVVLVNILTQYPGTNFIPQLTGPPIPSHLTVPLPDGTLDPILTIPTSKASLMLGIWFGPTSRGTKHMKEMCSKGFVWADKLNAHPLPPSVAWISFSFQLCPGMLWGITTVVLSSQELYQATRIVFFWCLPLLGVQQHIELPWRTLPEMYQGIGLPNFALISLAAKLQCIQCNWGFNKASSRSLTMGYESFLMEFGLSGNTFSYDYTTFSDLATDGTWFKNVWELLNEFQVTAEFGREHQLAPIRSGDRSLMNLFSQHYRGHDLESINVFHQHKKAIHVSCIVMSDGCAVDPDSLTKDVGWSERHKFPHQRPSRADHQLLVDAIMRISSPFLRFDDPLGEYIAPPHKSTRWTTDLGGSILHLEMVLVDNSSKYIVYKFLGASQTRSGCRFMQTKILENTPLPCYASVLRINNSSVQLRSRIKGYKTQHVSSSFWDNIRSYGNPSIWRNLHCHGDGSWIWQGLCSGSLVIVHDGSYMKEVSLVVCSAAILIYCKLTGSSCKCTIAEKSPSAGSYRGEILGTILTQLILRAAVQGHMGLYPVIIEDCDNDRVVKHGNAPF
jgi:hypothetical protein